MQSYHQTAPNMRKYTEVHMPLKDTHDSQKVCPCLQPLIDTINGSREGIQQYIQLLPVRLASTDYTGYNQ